MADSGGGSSSSTASAPQADVEQGKPQAKALPFVAVGRVKDAVCLALCSSADAQDQEEHTAVTFGKLLQAAKIKLKPGHRTRLQLNKGSLVCMMDQKGEILLCVVTAFLQYPERFAYQMLSELNGIIKNKEWLDEKEFQDFQDIQAFSKGGLNKFLKPKMLALIDKYDDPANFDQFQKAMSKINTVKDNMKANIAQVQETGQNMQALQSKTEGMASSASAFNQASAEVEDKYRCELLKERLITAVSGLLVLGVGGYLFYKGIL
eukprot:TRINITY_DN59285_c0_g1_i1.p1 TRINITY_DN59285_c0_g1~~TRINITY_DN59285_c0_g1_i1.p1  ORF type:complete len:263 (-),score=90.46 TRINITY_DN59285_c0_g1_i1:106-894(-)